MEGLNQVCYATRDLPNPWSIDTYYHVCGYDAWKQILNEKTTPDSIIGQIKERVTEFIHTNGSGNIAESCSNFETRLPDGCGA